LLVAVENKFFLSSRNQKATTFQRHRPRQTLQNYSSACSESTLPSPKKFHLEQANSMTLPYEVGFVGATKDCVHCARVVESVPSLLSRRLLPYSAAGAKGKGRLVNYD
jgi:hypothetical protein